MNTNAQGAGKVLNYSAASMPMIATLSVLNVALESPYEKFRLLRAVGEKVQGAVVLRIVPREPPDREAVRLKKYDSAREYMIPIYDFKCRECGKISEILVRSIEDRPGSCPECGNYYLERLVSASATIRMESTAPGTTCCGRTERCETPSCSTGNSCKRK